MPGDVHFGDIGIDPDSIDLKGSGEEGGRWSCGGGGEEDSSADGAGGAFRGTECQGLLSALHRMSALRFAVSERGAEAFDFAGTSDAAGDVLRARMVPYRVQQVRGCLPFRPDQKV